MRTIQKISITYLVLLLTAFYGYSVGKFNLFPGRELIELITKDANDFASYF